MAEPNENGGGARASWQRGTALAILALAVLTALKVSFEAWLGQTVPFLLYGCVVFVASWYGGKIAGLVATALSAALVGMFTVGSAEGMAWTGRALQTGLFVAEGALVTMFVDRIRVSHGAAIRAARDARTAAAKLDAVLLGMSDGITMQTGSGELIYVNQPAAELCGFATADELLGAATSDLVARFEMFSTNGEAFPFERLPGRALLHGRPAEEQTVRFRVRATGEERWSVIHANAIRDDEGALQFVVNTFRDVTRAQREEQRRGFLAKATEELNSSLDFDVTLATVARLAVPSIADWCAVDILEGDALRRLAVAHRDPEKIAIVSELERRYPEDPKADRGVPQIIRSGKPQMVEHIPEAMLIESARDEEHAALIRQLGLRSYVGVPLERGGTTFGAISFAMAESLRNYELGDLATATALADRAAIAIENSRLYAAAESARAEAEQANRTKDEFLAMLGHELRNPLAPIVTALELLRSSSEGVLPREYVVIERQVHHLTRLVDDLLDVSRITRGRIELHKQPIALGEVVERALEMSRPLLEQRKHALTVEVDPDAKVDGDDGRLAQVIGNLLNNAAKYTEPGGHIAIRIERVEARVLIRVRDDGIGIAPEMLPRIFELFVQEPQAIDRAQGGLGLGLGIVRSLVALHGGTVGAHSEGVGKGSEVVVDLPGLDPSTVVTPSPPESRPAPTRKLRVLVVDDNVDARELLQVLLERLGHEVHSAPDAATALELATTVHADLGLFDIGLPDIDGYELARRLRALDGVAPFPVVAMTGYGQEGDRRRSAEAGFAAHLVKPVSIEAIRQTLATWT